MEKVGNPHEAAAVMQPPRCSADAGSRSGPASNAGLFLRRHFHWLIALVVMMSAGAATASVQARPAPAAAVASAQRGAGLEDRAALAAFVDGIIGAQMAQQKLPLAAVAVVKDGRIILSKGYGYADRERQLPFDPATSLVRLASITKVFTEVAVLQLVAAGKLDLDRDVNAYLTELEVPSTFRQPVTLRHLLTHTAGFEESFFGHGRVRDPSQALMTAAYLRAHMPARVRPPGEMQSYSNFGIALAGLIVEAASGESYASYVERHIFRPLGMAHTTARTPVPSHLEASLVQGYAYEQGRYERKPFELHAFVPAGSASASVEDTARFMIALLQEGRYGNARILDAPSTRLLLTGGFQPDRRLPPGGLGLFGRDLNGVRIAGHTGDTGLFHNYLYLVPEHDFGIFVVYMGDDGVSAREAFMRAFFDRYFPPREIAQDAVKVRPGVAEKLAGSYALIRRNHTRIDKLPTTWGALLHLDALPGGQLHATWPVLGWEWRFAPLASDYFRDATTCDELIFHFGQDGDVRYVLTDLLPFLAFEPLAWYETPSFWLPALGLCALVFLTLLLWLPRRLRMAEGATRRSRRALLLGALMAGWAYLSVIAVAVAFLLNPPDHVAMAIKVALGAPLVFVGLAITAATTLVLAWRGASLSLTVRLHHALAIAAALTLCLFFFQWNLLGWHFG